VESVCQVVQIQTEEIGALIFQNGVEHFGKLENLECQSPFCRIVNRDGGLIHGQIRLRRFSKNGTDADKGILKVRKESIFSQEKT